MGGRLPRHLHQLGRGEPIDAGGNDDYAELRPGGAWNDLSGNEYLWGLVELNVSQAPATGQPGPLAHYLLDVTVADTVPPRVVEVRGLPAAGESTAEPVQNFRVRLSEALEPSRVAEAPRQVWRYGGHFYTLTEAGTTREEAEAQALGGHLVTVNDEAEQNWLTATFGQRLGSYWIGLRDGRLEAAREGSLTSNDPLNPTRTNRYCDDYLLTELLSISPGETITLVLESIEFDAYLQVIDGNKGTVLLQDDDSAENLNSALSLTVQGDTTYMVRVTSYGSYATGNYTLKMISQTGWQWTDGAPLEYNSNWGYAATWLLPGMRAAWADLDGLWHATSVTNIFRGVIELEGPDQDAGGLPDVLDPYAADPLNLWDLREAGPDGRFDTGDDLVYTLNLFTPYAAGSLELSFHIPGGPLPSGQYRFTLTPRLVDEVGNALDGDGQGGEAFQRLFAVAVPAGVTLESPCNDSLTSATPPDPAGGSGGVRSVPGPGAGLT